MEIVIKFVIGRSKRDSFAFAMCRQELRRDVVRVLLNAFLQEIKEVGNMSIVYIQRWQPMTSLSMHDTWEAQTK